MRRVTIINSYSVRNAGDAAIMLATANLMYDMGFEMVSVSSRHWEEDDAFYSSYSIGSVPPVVAFPTRGSTNFLLRTARFGVSLITAVFVVVLLRLLPSGARGILGRHAPAGIRPLLESEAVVLAGGGYLYSAKRKFNLSLIHVIVQIWIARLLQKPLIMMPQSVGPFVKEYDKALVRWAHREIKPLIVRDRESVRTSTEDLRRSKNEIRLLPDIVFYGLSDRRVLDHQSELQSNTDVLIVAMDWTWARNAGSTALDLYVSKLANTVSELATLGYTVSLAGNSRIPEQNQDDFEVARLILSRSNVSGKTVRLLDSETDMHGLIIAMKQARVVIGTRLHSCILSLVSGTPTIALAYQPKTTGTYQLLGLGSYVHDVEDFDSDRLVAQAVSILNNEQAEQEKIGRAVLWARGEIRGHYLRGAGMTETIKPRAADPEEAPRV